MKAKARLATKIGLAANIFLFIIKAVAGFMSNSIALISDAANSFLDIFGSVIIYIAVKIGYKKADTEHPFGHHRAEPIAGLIIAVLTGILGFELLKESIIRTFSSPEQIINGFAMAALMIAIVVKTAMFIYFNWISSKIKSPAMHAYAVDSRNDVLVSSVALFGIIMTKQGIQNFDGFAGILISLWIFRVGYKLALENIDFLMGKSPDEKFIQKMRKKALKIKGVTGVNDIRAHYVGKYIHVELHAEVDSKDSSVKAHNISKKVQFALEDMHDVNKAFIHIDPKKKRNKN